MASLVRMAGSGETVGLLHDARAREDVPIVMRLPRRSRLLVKGRAEMGTRTLLSFIPILLNTEWADSRKFRVP